MQTLIRNIAQLVAVPPGPVRGRQMGMPPIYENAAVLIQDDVISWFGPAAEAPGGAVEQIIDAEGGTVVPGLVDCHTHAVFAGSREHEHVRRINGATYLEILQAGGGINESVRALRAASMDELLEQSRPRLRRMLAAGVTTLEIKSGYGLSPEDELKMLWTVRRLADELPMELVPTYLGAHAIPPEWTGRADDYLARMTDPRLLKQMADEGLAEFADVFCEQGAFDLEQSRRFLTACREYGLKPKIHAEQISRTGAVDLAISLGAVSADHLECVDEPTLAVLARSRTIPVLLPGCSFFLGTPPAPARRMIEADLPIALSTDCNPGSSMIDSLPLIMSIAASMLRMTPLESLVACTANAAAALDRADLVGAVARGHQADLLILGIPNVDCWAYQVGVNPVRSVIRRGRIVLQN